MFALMLTACLLVPRPANILISRANIPVLIDFGFAETYEPERPEAFVSNLSYGTPEVGIPGAFPAVSFMVECIATVPFARARQGSET